MPMVVFGTGEWINDKARCPECIEKEMIRDYVIDMEFVPFDENGLIIQDVSGKYPLPDVAGTDADGSDIRLMFSKIRGVDIESFTSKENFYSYISKEKKMRGLLSDRKVLIRPQQMFQHKVVLRHNLVDLIRKLVMIV